MTAPAEGPATCEVHVPGRDAPSAWCAACRMSGAAEGPATVTPAEWRNALNRLADQAHHTAGSEDGRTRVFRDAQAVAAHIEALTADLAAAREDVDRYRARIHEAVDECQRRHAPFVKRCADLDQTASWYRLMLASQGEDEKSWTWNSHAMRSLALTIVEERDDARQVIANVQAALHQGGQNADIRCKAAMRALAPAPTEATP